MDTHITQRFSTWCTYEVVSWCRWILEHSRDVSMIIYTDLQKRLYYLSLASKTAFFSLRPWSRLSSEKSSSLSSKNNNTIYQIIDKYMRITSLSLKPLNVKLDLFISNYNSGYSLLQVSISMTQQWWGCMEIKWIIYCTV